MRAGVEALVSRLALPVEVQVTRTRLPPDIEASAYFIVAEALTNVVKHARATRAEVRLHFTPEHVTLAIVDDGIGYTASSSGVTRADLPAGASGGMGLRGIRERLAPLNGTLAISASPGGGTTLRVTVPVTQSSEVSV